MDPGNESQSKSAGYYSKICYGKLCYEYFKRMSISV